MCALQDVTHSININHKGEKESNACGVCRNFFLKRVSLNLHMRCHYGGGRPLIFGDSHVTKMERLDMSGQFVYYGVSGLKIANWKEHVGAFSDATAVIIQLGGNDVTVRPWKVEDPDFMRQTVQNYKDLMEELKKQRKQAFIIPCLERTTLRQRVRGLNQRLEKRFRACYLQLNSAWELHDGTHLKNDEYRKLNELLKGMFI